MFQLYADKTKLTVRQREPVTSGSVNVYEARFEFSPDWDGLTRTAVFKSGSQAISVLLDETGQCVIPWEVTDPDDKGKALYAGIYGARDGTVVLPTVWASLGVILEGVSCCGANARPPTLELWRQELAQKQNKLTGLPGQIVGFDANGVAVAQDAPSGGGEGGGIAYQFGHGLKQTGNLVTVDTTDDFTGDNTLPMTAAGVQTTVGNIEILLKTI